MVNVILPIKKSTYSPRREDMKFFLHTSKISIWTPFEISSLIYEPYLHKIKFMSNILFFLLIWYSYVMRFKKRKLFLISSIFLLALSCNGTHKNRVFERVHQFKHYDFDSSTTLMDRVQDTPNVVLDFLQVADNRPDYQNYMLSDSERVIVEENINLIPQRYKELLTESLIGIYFIEDFWGSGLTNYVVDKEDNIYTFVIINPKLLQMTLSEFYLYKEMTCFIKDDEDIHFKVNMSDDFSGILYILLHEFTHAIDYVYPITPYTSPEILHEREAFFTSGFIDDIWGGYDIKRDHYQIDIFDRVSYYGFNKGPLMNITYAVELYTNLEQTPFITPYATLSWAEDLAELYSIRYLVEELNCNFAIEIYDKEELLYTYEPIKREILQNRFNKNLYF